MWWWTITSSLWTVVLILIVSQPSGAHSSITELRNVEVSNDIEKVAEKSKDALIGVGDTLTNEVLETVRGENVYNVPKKREPENIPNNADNVDINKVNRLPDNRTSNESKKPRFHLDIRDRRMKDIIVHPDDATTPLPYNRRISFRRGQSVGVHGMMKSTRFEINLLSGSPNISGVNQEALEQAMLDFLEDRKNRSKTLPYSQTILHMKVLFDKNIIVFNTMKDNVWGAQETISTNKIHDLFYKGEYFDIRIRALDDRFEIWINRHKWYEYKHRLPVESIEYLAVHGTGDVEGVHVGGAYYPNNFVMVFPHGHFAMGSRMYMYVILTRHDFTISFTSKAGAGDGGGDKLFHFVYSKGSDPYYTSKIGGRNGAKIEGGMTTWINRAFDKGLSTDLVFLMEPYSIQIFIESERVEPFPHRCGNPNDCYKGIAVNGDLIVTGIEFS